MFTRKTISAASVVLALSLATPAAASAFTPDDTGGWTPCEPGSPDCGPRKPVLEYSAPDGNPERTASGVGVGSVAYDLAMRAAAKKPSLLKRHQVRPAEDDPRADEGDDGDSGGGDSGGGDSGGGDSGGGSVSGGSGGSSGADSDEHVPSDMIIQTDFDDIIDTAVTDIEDARGEELPDDLTLAEIVLIFKDDPRGGSIKAAVAGLELVLREVPQYGLVKVGTWKESGGYMHDAEGASGLSSREPLRLRSDGRLAQTPSGSQATSAPRRWIQGLTPEVRQTESVVTGPGD